MWSTKSEKETTSHCGNMAVLAFGKAILLWCVRARKSLLNSQGFTIMRKCILDVFCPIVILKKLNGLVKDILNLGN